MNNKPGSMKSNTSFVFCNTYNEFELICLLPVQIWTNDSKFKINRWFKFESAVGSSNLINAVPSHNFFREILSFKSDSNILKDKNKDDQNLALFGSHCILMNRCLFVYIFSTLFAFDISVPEVIFLCSCFLMLYALVAEVPGVAREIIEKRDKKINLNKKTQVLSPEYQWVS